MDPVKYDLLFERFLSVHRKGSVPDVDLDFAADRRSEMFQYAVEKYGAGRCAKVSTFGMRKAKASLRDTARVFDIDQDTADEAAKLIPQVYYDDDGEKTTDLSIEESMQIVPKLRELAEQYPDWFSLAIKLEDLPRNASIHAAGTLVSPVDLIDYVPLVKPKNDEEINNINATALNLTDAERAGFIKFDFLGLATLSVIEATQRDTGYSFDFVAHNYKDQAAWDLIGSKHTTGLFQIASRVYKDRMHRLKPQTIKELAACLALVRGPCISSGDDQRYIEILEGKRQIELIHPLYDQVTKDTNGILLYQEQLMKICVNFGFTLEDGYRIMKAASKKKIEALRSYGEQFLVKAKDLNVQEDVAQRIFKMIVDSGLYSFNESHAVAYALLCYQSAYLKAHFPLEYMKNALTNAYLRKEEMDDTVQECRRLGFRFKPLDVNNSLWEFVIEDDLIRVGMCAVKSFGESAAQEVMAKRPYVSLKDFLDKIEKGKCTKRSIVPAIFAGMFCPFELDRRTVFSQFCELREEEMPAMVKLQGGIEFDITDPYDKIEEVVFGASLVANPVNDYQPIGWDKIKPETKVTIDAVIRRVKKLKDKNSQMMAFLGLETADGIIDSAMFSSVYAKYKSFCKKDLIVKVTGKKTKDESMIISSIE